MYPELPIDVLVPDIVETVRRNSSCILEAPPGAGKTTRVPRALVQAQVVAESEIIVLQPRRLPTRLAAARVAEELGEPIGKTVGYQVRFEEKAGPSTRVRFVTEGVLTRRLIQDPTLSRVGMVILDEFHERHLTGDLALALLKRLQKTSRPDLKLLVMSATLNVGPLTTFLENPPILKSEGKRYEVVIDHQDTHDVRPIEQQVLSGLKKVIAKGCAGDILVFLPGASEIRKSHDACREFAERHRLSIHHLHGDLSAEEQDRAVRPSRQQKLILSTNVAETSVTIPGVSAVIDSGLARTASYSPWTGLPSLKLSKICKASAIQRAGRAGRTQNGYCFRLYTRDDFQGRGDFDIPEIARMDLTETVLGLHAQGITDARNFDFFEPPSLAALDSAEQLLTRLSAFDKDGQLSTIGRALLKFPLHPRLGRLLFEAEKRGIASTGALAAALMSERDIRREAKARVGSVSSTQSHPVSSSDVLEMIERFQQASASNFSPSGLHSLNLDTQAVASVTKVYQQIQRQQSRRQDERHTPEDLEQALGLSLLSAFPDRVARRRKPLSTELTLSNGGSAQLSETSSVREAEFLLALDLEERSIGKGTAATVRLASAIEAEWLLELLPEQIDEIDDLVWNSETGRVERHTRMAFGSVLLEETRQPAMPSDKTTDVLAQALLQMGIQQLGQQEAWEEWKTRVELLRETFPDAHFPLIDQSFFQRVLRGMCEGKRNFQELEAESIVEWATHQLSPEQMRKMATMLPARWTLPSGRQVPIHYEPGKPPWLESRLQDFFGLARGPSICGGKIPVVLHLLAPNHRAVQVTSDLAGFWSRHYPSIRRELSRKYPRHAWPDDPLTAVPPANKQR